MWHNNTIGIFISHSQMKIGMILRCHKIKILSGHMMTGVLLWLCWMIVEEYMLGCWMDECIWLECIPCGAWWPLKMAQMGWKMDFAGLMGCEKLEIFFDRSLIPFYGNLALHLWLFWWGLFVDRSCLKIFETQKVHFQLFCFSTDFNFVSISWRVWLGESLRFEGMRALFPPFFYFIGAASRIPHQSFFLQWW